MTGPLLTARLRLGPLRVDDADEMADVLDDPALHVFTGGVPPTAADLRERYRAQVVGRSADGAQRWFNWIVRDRETREALGFVQATVTGARAELAWVIGTAHQGRGFAREAAAAMAADLRDSGVTGLAAYVHRDHLASTAVARELGLVATGRLVDGEVEWRLPAVEPVVGIRTAGPDDLPALLPFWAVAAEDAHRPADRDDAVRRLFARDPQALLVATVGDVLVGTLIAGHDGWRCHLYRLAVHPSWATPQHRAPPGRRRRGTLRRGGGHPGRRDGPRRQPRRSRTLDRAGLRPTAGVVALGEAALTPRPDRCTLHFPHRAAAFPHARTENVRAVRFAR